MSYIVNHVYICHTDVCIHSIFINKFNIITRLLGARMEHKCTRMNKSNTNKIRENSLDKIKMTISKQPKTLNTTLTLNPKSI